MPATLQQRFEAARTEPDQLARLIDEAVDSGRAREAVTWSEHLSRIDPDRVRRYMLHARTLAAAGRFSAAEKTVEKYEQLYGIDAGSLTTRAEIAQRRHREAAAEELLLDALRLQPDHERATRLLESIAARHGNRAATLLDQASEAGSVAAKLALAERYLGELRYDEAEELLRQALSAGTHAVRQQVSYVMVAAGLYERALRLLLPDLRENDPALVNVLHALVRSERWSDADALLKRETSDEPAISFYRHQIRMALDPPAAAKRDSLLLDALAGCARMDTPKTRQKLYRKLLAAELLLAFELPLSRDSADRLLRGAPPVVRTTGTLAQTLLAFTGLDALRAWSTESFSASVPLRDIARFCSTANLELIINPAGPSSAELGQKELDALARGEVPLLSEAEVAARTATYVFEPVARPYPDALLQQLRDDLAEYPEIIEAYLVEIVGEKRGRVGAVAVRFSESRTASERRDVLFDLIDPTIHRERSRRIHLFEASPELLPLVRRLGFWLIEEPG